MKDQHNLKGLGKRRTNPLKSCFVHDIIGQTFVLPLWSRTGTGLTGSVLQSTNEGTQKLGKHVRWGGIIIADFLASRRFWSTLLRCANMENNDTKTGLIVET